MNEEQELLDEAKRKEEEVKRITEKPKDYEPNIFQAASNGNLTSVQWHIEREHTNINAKDNDGRTALHYASSNSHLNIVSYLVEHNADINAKNNKGYTALHFASKEEIQTYLKQHGAN